MTLLSTADWLLSTSTQTTAGLHSLVNAPKMLACILRCGQDIYLEKCFWSKHLTFLVVIPVAGYHQ